MKRDCKIFPVTPVVSSRLVLVRDDVGEVIATAEAECEVVVRNVILGSAALPTPPRQHFFVPRHRLSAVATQPVCPLVENSWIGFPPLLTDVFPLRPVVKAHAMTTLSMGILLGCKVAMVHSNPPFWPPVFLGAYDYNK